MSEEKPISEEKLVRSISRWDLTAIAINMIIGAGIFGLPAKVYEKIGGWSLLAFVICALIVGLVVLCFAEVASRFQSTGGMYLYAKEAFGSVVGFEVGWLYWVVRVTTYAANCNLLIDYLNFFYPDANSGASRIVLITLITVLLTAVNILGVKQSMVLTNIFTVGKILPLIIFVAFGIFFIQPGNFSFAITPDYTAFSSATLMLIYAFVGFEAMVIPAGESKNPRRDMPFALLIALAVVAVLFILIQIVAIGTLPELAKSSKPLADSALVFMGAGGAALITIGAVISILGNLNSGYLAATRIPFAMSEQKELPAIIGKTHPKFKTPIIAIFATAVPIFIWTMLTDFKTAAIISTITRLIVYSTSCAALPVFRGRGNTARAEFKAPFGFVVSALSIGLIIWLLTQVDFTKEGLAILISAGIGLAIFFISKFFKDERIA